MTDGATITRDDGAKLLLRLAAGGLMLFHGIDKLSGGIDGIVGMVEGRGLPSAFAYGVYVGEVVAPLLLVLGLFVRPAAVVLAVNMVVAVWLAHSGDLFSLGGHGAYALELHVFYLFTAIALALTGGGRIALGRRG